VIHSRRAVLAAGLGLAACKPTVASPPQPTSPPLKSVAPFPVGAAVQAGQLDDPALAALLADNVSQLTAEWEMKM